MSSLKMDQVWFPDSEFNVTLPCIDAEAQSSKDINCEKYWLNNTLERQILQGTKLRQEKSQHYSVVHEYDNVVNINYLRPSCIGTRRNRKRPNKYSGIGTTPCPPRSYSPCKGKNSSARTFKPLTKNKSRSTTLHINKSRKKCHMRTAELAVPTKRQCIDTWRNKYKVLPGYMLDRLKQHVLNQRPVIYIPDAFNCFKIFKRKPKGFRRQAAAKDIIKNSHMTEIRKLCTIFGIRIAQILNKPLDVTLNLQLETISKIVTKDILSEILNDQKKIYNNDVTSQKILSVIADKVTIWIATILEESSYKLLEEELRELEEEEGPVLDFLNNLVDIVVKTSEPISSNFDDNYDIKSEVSYTEDISENVLDEQYEKIDLSPDDTFHLGTPISDQKETSNYDIEESMSTHKNLVAVDISQTILSDGSSDNLPKIEELTKGDENISNDIKKEVNNIIDNVALELAPVTLYTESYNKELNEDLNISKPDVHQNQLFDLENQSKNNTNYDIHLNKTPIEENIHDDNEEYMNEQSKDFRSTEASFVQNTLNDLELQSKNDSDELAKFYEFQPKDNAEINDTDQLDNVETRDNKKEHYKKNHVIDFNATTPNIIQDSLMDIELNTKNDKDEHNNQTNDTNTKNRNQINNVKIDNNYLENYKEEYVEDSDVHTPNIFQNTIPDIEIRSKSENINEYQTKYNVETDDNNELNNDEIINDQKEHSKVEPAEDLKVLSNIAQDQLSDIEVQTKSSNNEDIDFYKIQTTGNIEIQNNNEFDIEDVGNQFQDLEGPYKQIEDADPDGQNDVSNVSGVFEIFSEELTDEKNKKVKFSNTDIVTQGDLLQPKINSETRLVENSNRNDPEQVLWEPALDNITFAEAHNNLLMNFDESWPADIRSPVLKPSESVSRSITSLGKILETDEKVSSPEPEDNISLIDSTEHIEPSVKTSEGHGTAVFDNAISSYSNLDTFGIDDNTSEPYLTHEFEIISQLHIDDINESIKQTDDDIMTELHEYNVEDYIPKLNELDIIQTINAKKVCTKGEDKRKMKTNTIIKTKRRPKKPMLQHKTETAFKSNKMPLPKNKLKTVVTGQYDKRVGKRTERKYKQEIVEEVDNFCCPTSEHKLDYKVYPETAPAWVSRAQGESDEYTSERILKNNRKQIIMEYDMRKLCKDLRQGFINLEMWNEWIQNICNNVELLQQKSAAKTSRRDLEYLVKLKNKINEDATLWMKLKKCMQQRMKYYGSKDKYKSKVKNCFASG